MKRFPGIILSLILLLVCSACGNAGDDAAAPVSPTASSTTPQPTVYVSPSPTPSSSPKVKETTPPVKEEYVPETVLIEGEELSPDVYVAVSVNPCIGFLVDSNDNNTVCGVTFVNEDAAKILDAADFLGRTFGEAYAALLAAFVDNGYAQDGILAPEVTFAEITFADGEYVTTPVEDAESTDLPAIENLSFYTDTLNNILTDALESGTPFDPAAAAEDADRAMATASVERREYTYTVDPIPFDKNMYSWRFSMPLENTGSSPMNYQSCCVKLRLGGQTGTLVREVVHDLDRWTSRGRPAEIAPGNAYTYNDGYPVEGKSHDYMGYFFTFTDGDGKTIEIIYHFNLTFNLPPDN